MIFVTSSQHVHAWQVEAGEFAATVAKPFTAETLLVAMDEALRPQ